MVAQSPPYAEQNAQHDARLFRLATFSAWRDVSGIVGPTDLGVTAQPTPNMSVQVGAGRAWIKGTQVSSVAGGSWSTQGAYYCYNDAPVSLTVAAADPTNPRIDAVVAYVTDAFYSGATNTFVLGIVTGTPAASPSAPAVPSNGLLLGTLAVAANATSIAAGNISATPLATLLLTARGGIPPVLSTDVAAGSYTGQQRDFPTGTSGGAGGPQRWNASAWQPLSALDFPVAVYRQTVPQTGLPASSWQTIICDAKELDTHNAYNSATGVFTVPAGQGGTYRIAGAVAFLNAPAGAGLGVKFTVNNTSMPASIGTFFSEGASVVNPVLSLGGRLIVLAAGDQVRLVGWDTAGGWFTQASSSADGAPWLCIERVR